MNELVIGLSARLSNWRHIFGDEAFRLFFPLAAIQGALWPFLWVAVGEFNLAFTENLPSTLWHAQEMIVGCFGASLIGFLLTAVPEWTDTKPIRGATLFWLAGAWFVARLVGFVGYEPAIFIAAFCDLAWVGYLIYYVAQLSIKLKSDRLVGFLFWLALFFFSVLFARVGLMQLDFENAQKWVYISGFIFLGFLGLALSRITVAVTNLVLDPTEKTSPFRPHPGRKNLASTLVFIAICATVYGLSDEVVGLIWIAAGAAFLDRVAEHFVGRAFFRLEIGVLALSSLFSGAGLLLFGLSELQLFDIPPMAGIHLAFMGGLGMGVMAVFSIAGLMHAGRELPFPAPLRWAHLCFGISVLMRIGPDLGWFDHPLGIPYLLATVFWALALLIWLWIYLPFLSDGESLGARRC